MWMLMRLGMEIKVMSLRFDVFSLSFVLFDEWCSLAFFFFLGSMMLMLLAYLQHIPYLIYHS